MKHLKKDNNSLPGIGVGGKTLCPITNGLCQKEACEFWVELKYGDASVGRCSYAWQAILLTEIRTEIEKLKNTVK